MWVDGDRARLLQIIGNLLANATKFTPPGGAVILSLRRLGGTAELSVKDNGYGIAATLLPKVFELFVQGEQDEIGRASRRGKSVSVLVDLGVIRISNEKKEK